MQCHSTACTASSNTEQDNRPTTHTTWPGHVLMGHSWSKATSWESRTVSCAPRPPTFSHVKMDLKQTASPHCRGPCTLWSYRTTKTPHIDSPHPQSHLCTHLLRSSGWNAQAQEGCQACSVVRCVSVVRLPLLSPAWERGCLFASGLCSPVRTGFNRRTNPPWSSSRSSIFTTRSSVLLCVSIEQSHWKRVPERELPVRDGGIDNAMSYTNCTISLHNEATQPVFAYNYKQQRVLGRALCCYCVLSLCTSEERETEKDRDAQTSHEHIVN